MAQERPVNVRRPKRGAMEEEKETAEEQQKGLPPRLVAFFPSRVQEVIEMLRQVGENVIDHVGFETPAGSEGTDALKRLSKEGTPMAQKAGTGLGLAMVVAVIFRNMGIDPTAALAVFAKTIEMCLTEDAKQKEEKEEGEEKTEES